MINSYNNKNIKSLIKLIKKSRIRKETGFFTVEGIQENKLALKNLFIPKLFFICSSIFSSKIKINEEIYYVSKIIYNKIAFRGTTEGIIGVYKIPILKYENFILPKNSKIIIIESIEKPGNLGAILRNCDAFSIDLLIICDSQIDLFNPNVIRSSLGSIFTVPILIMNKINCVKFCKKNKLKIFTTFLKEKKSSIKDINFNKPCAIVFGNEHYGVNIFWKKYSNENFYIPIKGQIGSLNVSNAIAIILYEMFKNKI